MTAGTTTMLGSLVGDEDVFLAEHWRRAPLHRQGYPLSTSPFRLSLDDVVAAVTNPMLRAPFFLMTKDGLPLTADRMTRRTTIAGVEVADLADAMKIIEQFHDGATLVLRGAAQQIPALAQPCAVLSRELGAEVIAHLFLTPAAARGFTWHRDAEDVVVVQLAGVKSWDLAPEALQPGVRGVLDAADADFPEDGVIRVNLAEGDVLYLPSGTPHRAAATDAGASMHLSLGIKQAEWTRLLGPTLSAAIQALPTVAPLHPEPDAARGWLERLGETAARLVGELPQPRPWQPAPTSAVSDELRAQFPGWR